MPIWPVSRRPRCSALPAAAVASVRSPSGRALQKGAHVVNFLAFMFASTNPHRRTRIDDPDPVGLGVPRCRVTRWSHPLIAVMAVIVQLTLPETLFEEVRTELNQRDHDHGVTEDPTCGMEGRDEYSLVTDGGETLKSVRRVVWRPISRVASSGSWRDELLSWGGWYKVGNQYRKGVVDALHGRDSGLSDLWIRHRVRPTVGLEHAVLQATASLSALRTQSWAWLSLLLASSVAWETSRSPLRSGVAV